MTKQELEALERSSFNSFDPDGFDLNDDFDPDGFDNATGAPAQKLQHGKVGKLQAQFDIIITSSLTNTGLNIELFQGFRSIQGAANPAVNVMTPIDNDVIAAAISQAAGAVDTSATLLTNRVWVNTRGDLVFSDPTTLIGRVTIRCRQVPYYALLKSSMVQPFKVEKLRMTVTTSNQIDNDINHVSYTFLGSVKRNTISPRAYFRPDQFQSLIIDIPAAFRIDGEKGLEYFMNPKTGGNNEVVTFNMFMSKYIKQAI